MSSATNGRAREHRVRDHLVSHGWKAIMRSAGSKGSADLLVAHPTHGAALVQVGTAGKTLGPADRERFCTDADLCGALPILAVCATGRAPWFWHVNRDVPTNWESWSP
jgi:hypothetical protein